MCKYNANSILKLCLGWTLPWCVKFGTIGLLVWIQTHLHLYLMNLLKHSLLSWFEALCLLWLESYIPKHPLHSLFVIFSVFSLTQKLWPLENYQACSTHKSEVVKQDEGAYCVWECQEMGVVMHKLFTSPFHAYLHNHRAHVLKTCELWLVSYSCAVAVLEQPFRCGCIRTVPILTYTQDTIFSLTNSYIRITTVLLNEKN